MNLFIKLVRNSFWLLSARIGAQVCMVIVTYLLARRLGVSGFGEYTFIVAAIMIGNTLTTFGSDMYLIRSIAIRSEISELSSALGLQLALSCLFIGSIFLFAPHLPNQTFESTLALKIYSFALIPLAFYTVFTSALRGAQKMTSYAWLNLLIPVLQVIAISIFVQRGSNLILLVIVLLVVQIIGTFMGGMFCYTTIPNFWVGYQFSANGIMSLFVACLPIALISILGIVYQKLSLTMLPFLGTASMLGLFSAATRVTEAARMGHIAVFTTLYPMMANAGQKKGSTGIFRLSFFLLLAVSTGVSVLLFILAEPIVGIFFGSGYQLSIPVLKILSFTLIPYTVNSYFSLAFLAKKQEKIIVRVLAASLLFLLILNLLLIPRVGQVGAGWAVLIAEIVQAALYLYTGVTGADRLINNIHSKGVSYELSELS